MTTTTYNVRLPVFQSNSNIRNKQIQFEKDNPTWCAVLRERAKQCIAGEDVDISPFLRGEAKDYYNDCLTQLFMYR